jgi:hypothetical protein
MAWFRHWLLALALLIPGVAAAGDAEDLARLIQANRWPVVTGETGLGGPGADRIAGWAGGVNYFMLGENHGNAGMARFATALSITLAGKGYGYTAIEADPLMTGELVRLLGGGKPALAAWMGQDQRQRAIPFYFWSEEADFILAAMKRGPVWGLDQSFVAAAHVHLDAIAARTRSPKARAIATELAAEARKDVMGFIGKVDLERLTALRTAMAKGDPAIALTEQFMESVVIYAPFIRDDGGSTYAGNLKRETLMKTLFQANIDAVTRPGRAAPKVLFKFGANHLMRGLSMTHMPSFGSYIAETALAKGQKAFNLRMMCGPGTRASLFDGSDYNCEEEEFAGIAGAFKPFLFATGDTLIDLRPLRDRPRLWKDWPAEAKELVWSYDAVVLIGASGGSHFLAALPKP